MRPSFVQHKVLILPAVVAVLLLQTTQTYHCSADSVYAIGVTAVSYKKNKTLKR